MTGILPHTVPNPRRWGSANPEGGFLLAPFNLLFSKCGYTAAFVIRGDGNGAHGRHRHRVAHGAPIGLPFSATAWTPMARD
jgi:hypothetical protein